MMSLYKSIQTNTNLLTTAELGDYEDDIHTPGVISEFRFVPDSEQTEEMELEILERYKKCM